jgi:hypothetical protein
VPPTNDEEMKPPNDEHHTSSSDAIRVELERVLSSPDFQASQRLGNFLRFVVEEKLSGRGHLLKGYTIATSVFGRDKDFDADLDPIVRIEAETAPGSRALLSQNGKPRSRTHRNP